MVGILALQGSFAEHKHILDQIGIPARYVRSPDDLEHVERLILPGGESTTIAKLLRHTGLFELVRTRVKSGMPIYGTCAGMILLAKNIPYGFQLMDIWVERNAYGPQNHSSIEDISIPLHGTTHHVSGIMIRAPRVTGLAPHVDIINTTPTDPLLVRQRNMLASSFHPELTKNGTVHHFFASML